jgi:hypothetical protein
MNAADLLISQLRGGEWTILRAAEDLDNNNFHTHLPGGGESPLWIFGHIAVNEDWFLSILVTGGSRTVDPEIAEVYQADFPLPDALAHSKDTRSDVINLFRTQRKRVYAALELEDPATWDTPPPPGLPPIFTSRGAVWGILGTHQYWHLGQLMSIRTMLGKPTFQFKQDQHLGGTS